jgi:4-amino-4-deoxy-L-arabinose transferase-like glycosyltransferase
MGTLSKPTGADFDIRESSRANTLILVAIAACVFALHLATNRQYGFHRDELQTLDDARYLDWGFVAYPPLTPFFGRLSQWLFDNSLTGARVFPALAQAFVIVLGGLMARELGGRRMAQVISAFAVAVAPVSLAAGALLQYVAFDFLWWVLLAWLVMRLIRTGDERLWLAIGAVIGLGMMTKYTMLFLVAGLAVGMIFTGGARYLKSRWLWMGVALSLLIFLANAIWQIQHHFITFDFLKYIHARDIRIGRTKYFLPEQLFVAANLLTIPLWIAGLVYYFRREGSRFQTIAWMFLVPLALFTVAKGRSYYMAPAYPMLLAAGAVWEEQWLARMKPRSSRAGAIVTITVFAIGGVLVAPHVLPITPINSKWFKASGDFREEIGWTDLAAEVGRIYHSLPADERAHTGILAANYGEAGAIGMYREQYGLPVAISGTNSYGLRGYPDPPPQTLIVLGLHRDDVDALFEQCELAGHNTNSYGVKNEESQDHPDIFLCHSLRQPWPEFWRHFRHFG